MLVACAAGSCAALSPNPLAPPHHPSNCTPRSRSCFPLRRRRRKIKAWQGATGYARNITYTNLTVDMVQTPIQLTQFYCPGNASACAVQVSVYGGHLPLHIDAELEISLAS